MNENDERDDHREGESFADVDLLPVTPVPAQGRQGAPPAAGGAPSPGTRPSAPLPGPVPMAPPVADQPPGGETRPAPGLSAETLFDDVDVEPVPGDAAQPGGDAAQPGADAAQPGADAAQSGADAAQLESRLSADALFDGVDAQEAPSWSAADGQHVAGMVGRLDTCRERLVAASKARAEQGGTAKAEFERTLAEAREALSQAGDHIEALSGREEAADGRQQLVDSYFRLDRVLDKYRVKGGADPNAAARAAALAADRKLAEKVRKTAGKKTKRKWTRNQKLFLVLGVLVLGRLVLLFVGTPETTEYVETVRFALPDGQGSHVHNMKPPTGDKADLAAPTIATLGLMQSKDGLLASVFATSTNPGQLRTTYTWWENDQILTVENTGKIHVSKLRVGAKYRVEVKVTDGKKSATSSSDPLVFKPKDPDQN